MHPSTIALPVGDDLRCADLVSHLRSCRLSLDIGLAQADIGFIDAAAHEVYLIEHEIHLICRILVTIDSDGPRDLLSDELDLVLIRFSELRLQVSINIHWRPG
jgi:hypothetical protein